MQTISKYSKIKRKKQWQALTWIFSALKIAYTFYEKEFESLFCEARLNFTKLKNQLNGLRECNEFS